MPSASIAPLVKGSSLQSINSTRCPSTIAEDTSFSRQAALQHTENRTLHLNDQAKNESFSYADNHVSTSKYTATSFIPKILFEFFRVVANCYFLLISILQVATPWSPTNQWTTAGPLIIVLLVTMVKQALEDKHRHAADEIQNNRSCQILGTRGELIAKKWRNVSVGDIMRLGNEEALPADLAILGTSEEEGRCFVETCNLDGETNLKRRVALKDVAKKVGYYRELNGPALNERLHAEALKDLVGKLTYEVPNNKLYNFIGRLEVDGISAVTVGPTNILLRGCSIRSCEYVYGLVLYTGRETKLMQNARSTPSKQSNLYRIVNRCISLIFLTQFILCVISTVSNGIWSGIYKNRIWYLPYVSSQSSLDTVVSFFTFLILYNNLVPISLYVSLDMIKVIQAKMISSDPEMIHKGVHAKARTSDLNEDLGQIQYIFSDKTGTLTRNLMEFRKASIGNKAYGFGTTEIGRAVAEAKKEELVTDNDAGIADPEAAQVNFDPSMSFDDPRLLEDLESGVENAGLIKDFLILISVCHTVIPEQCKDSGAITYRASSPDEEALVKAAKCLGYSFVTPAPDLKVNVTSRSGEKSSLDVQVLNVNEFNSTRKRMSVIVSIGDEIILYCKGADNVMLPRSNTNVYTDTLKSHIEQFAREGLRTLVLAKRVLTLEEYEAWDDRYQEASTAIANRDTLLDALAEEMEVQMELIGATGIEDKLQVGVPDAITSLAVAGIKLWVLTGDKEETAINIGYACRLLNDQMKLLVLNTHTKKDLAKRLDYFYTLPIVRELRQNGKTSSSLALICDGAAMVHIFDSISNTREKTNSVFAKKLLAIATCCSTVIACRVSPAQKADVVSLVKMNVPGNPMTLAIGDGANDVNMIQTAHVGVGISGQEGVQAVNASDFAIGQFRFLKPLVLVHGRYNYKRISKVILYSFYKNIALVIVLFLFNFYNGQSGTTLFESFVMAGWNFFLALPIIAIGIFDEDVPPESVSTYPKLYHTGQTNADLNVKAFLQWIGNAAMHAVICFVFPIMFLDTRERSTGIDDCLYLQGTIIYSGLLMTMNYKVAFMTLSWTYVNVLVFTFSILLLFLFLLTYPKMTFISSDMLGVGLNILSSTTIWSTLLLVPLSAILIDCIVSYVNSVSSPSPDLIIRERAVLRKKKKIRGRKMSTLTHQTFPSFSTSTEADQEGAIIEGYSGFNFSSPDNIRENASSTSLERSASSTELITSKVNSSRRMSQTTSIRRVTRAN